jgi:ferritin-like metal-binding protein YciE
VLPKLAREADSEWLAEALSAHLEQTREHAGRLEGVFVAAGAEPAAAASRALEGLRGEHDALVGSVVEPRLRDLFLAGGAAKTEHLEIALYTSLIGLAQRLGLDPDGLERNLEEERQALERVEDTARRLREQLPA